MLSFLQKGEETDRFKTDNNNNQVPSQEGDQNESRDQMIPQVTEYDPMASPPDISKAIKHGIARRVGRIDMATQKETEMEYCEDCGLPAKNQLLPICGSRLDLSEMGPGFPLYYEYLLFCGILLTILFGVVGVYNIVVNIQGTQCQLYSLLREDSCNGSFIILLSLGNRGPWEDFTVTKILNLVFVVVGVLVSFYYRRIQGLTAEEVDRGAVTPADYTIIVKGLPETENIDTVRKFFQDKGRSVKTCVKKVVCAYAIGSYVETLRKKAKLIARKGKEGVSEHLDTEIRQLEEQLDAFEAAVQNNTSQKFTGIAFVTFDSEKETKDVLDKFKMTAFEKTVYSFFSSLLSWLGVKFEKTFNGKIIDVDRAPEPFDVFWENLGHDWWDVFQKRTLTLLSSFILIALSFGMIIGISFLQDMIQKQTQNTTLITGLSLISSFLITIINTLIGFFMRKLAGFEKHTTYTYYFISIANKLSYAQFFNTALIVFIVALVKGEDIQSLWTSDSIVSKVFFLFALNAIVPSLTYFANPSDLWRIYKKSRLISDGQNSKLTQQEANALYEGPAFDIAQRYANVQKTMLFTGFYATLFPAGIAISILGLFLTYWTDKYMLLRRHCKPNALGQELSTEMADFLEFFFVSFMCGNLAFEKITRNEISLLTYIALGLSVAAYILPQKFLSKCIQPGDDGVFNSKPYDEAKFFFLTEYDRVNPLTQEDAIREWFIEMARVEEARNAQNVENEATTNAEENKPSMISFFENLPKEGTINTLLNYAQGPSFKQVQQNANINFARHMPRPQPGQPIQFQGNVQPNAYPNFQQARMANPQLNSFMNNFQLILANKLQGFPQQPAFMGQPRPQPVYMQSKPMVASHIPQVNQSYNIPVKPQMANHFPQSIVMPNRQVIPVTRAEANIAQVNAFPNGGFQQSSSSSNSRHQQRFFPIEQNVFAQQPPQQFQTAGFGRLSIMQTEARSNITSSHSQSRNMNGPVSNGFGNMASQFEAGLRNLGQKYGTEFRII